MSMPFLPSQLKQMVQRWTTYAPWSFSEALLDATPDRHDKDHNAAAAPSMTLHGKPRPSDGTPLRDTLLRTPCTPTPLLDALDANGRTALHVASLQGRADLARWLIEHGARLEVCDQDGMTPLHLAVANQHLGTVTVLLEAGADPNVRSEPHDQPANRTMAFTPLLVLIAVLRTQGLSAGASNDHDKPLPAPVLPIGDALVNAGADVTLCSGAMRNGSKENITPLEAVAIDHALPDAVANALIVWLVGHGADPYAQPVNARASVWALAQDHLDVLRGFSQNPRMAECISKWRTFEQRMNLLVQASVEHEQDRLHAVLAPLNDVHDAQNAALPPPVMPVPRSRSRARL